MSNLPGSDRNFIAELPPRLRHRPTTVCLVGRPGLSNLPRRILSSRLIQSAASGVRA